MIDIPLATLTVKLGKSKPWAATYLALHSFGEQHKYKLTAKEIAIESIKQGSNYSSSMTWQVLMHMELAGLIIKKLDKNGTPATIYLKDKLFSDTLKKLAQETMKVKENE